MTHFLRNIKPLLTAIAYCGVALSSWAAGPTLYGIKQYYGGEERIANGLYSIEPVAGAQPKLEWADGDLMGNGTVVYSDDGTLYVLSYVSMWGEVFWLYQVCDVEAQDYTFTYPENLDLVPDVAGTTSYDPTTSTAYAVCIGEHTDDKITFDLCTIDLTTCKKTHICPLEKRIFTLSFTAAGQMYGIAEDGYLYKIDKYNGKLTPVGFTGYIPTENQCAVIDYETNIMYWQSQIGPENGELYSVDITTGKATLITQFSPTFQFGGLFIKQKAQNSQAPAAPENLEAKFDGASLTGNLHFTLPSKDVQGNPLTGIVDWRVTLDGEELSTGSGQAGAQVAAPISAPERGLYRYVVEVSCGVNRGLASNTQLWVGMDTPQAATDFELTADEHTVTVKWSIPERGVHDGFVDHTKLRWLIDRGPEDVTIVDDHDKTVFTETLENRTGTYPVLYRLTPHVDGIVGEGVITPHVRAGEPFVPPFKIDLTNPFNSLIFDLVDSNHDKATWYWDYDHETMACMWPISDDRCRDDWMVSEAIRLEANKDYLMSVELASDGRWNYEMQDFDDVFSGELSAYIGTTNAVSDLDRCIMEKKDVTSVKWYTRYSNVFSVEQPGIYYIGLHCTGTRDVQNIYNTLVRAFKVESAASIIPNTADTDFNATVADGGIKIENPQGAVVKIYTPDGVLVTSTNDTYGTISLTTGIYIATCGNHAVKLAVR